MSKKPMKAVCIRMNEEIIQALKNDSFAVSMTAKEMISVADIIRKICSDYIVKKYGVKNG